MTFEELLKALRNRSQENLDGETWDLQDQIAVLHTIAEEVERVRKMTDTTSGSISADNQL